MATIGNTPNIPLNDDEYEALDDLLAGMGGSAMDVAMLEGFLTAVVIGPGAVAQEQWLPKVWGGQDGNDEAAGLVLRHYHYMRTWMTEDPASFEPIYECGGAWTEDAWCNGFMAGVELDADGWAPLLADDAAALAAFETPGGGDVTHAVIRINAFWKALRQARKAAPKIGRNDPCPCGSGKKYKKCCSEAG